MLWTIKIWTFEHYLPFEQVRRIVNLTLHICSLKMRSFPLDGTLPAACNSHTQRLFSCGKSPTTNKAKYSSEVTLNYPYEGRPLAFGCFCNVFGLRCVLLIVVSAGSELSRHANVLRACIIQSIILFDVGNSRIFVQSFVLLVVRYDDFAHCVCDLEKPLYSP